MTKTQKNRNTDKTKPDIQKYKNDSVGGLTQF